MSEQFHRNQLEAVHRVLQRDRGGLDPGVYPDFTHLPEHVEARLRRLRSERQSAIEERDLELGSNKCLREELDGARSRNKEWIAAHTRACNEHFKTRANLANAERELKGERARAAMRDPAPWIPPPHYGEQPVLTFNEALFRDQRDVAIARAEKAEGQLEALNTFRRGSEERERGLEIERNSWKKNYHAASDLAEENRVKAREAETERDDARAREKGATDECQHWKGEYSTASGVCQKHYNRAIEAEKERDDARAREKGATDECQYWKGEYSRASDVCQKHCARVVELEKERDARGPAITGAWYDEHKKVKAERDEWKRRCEGAADRERLLGEVADRRYGVLDKIDDLIAEELG